MPLLPFAILSAIKTGAEIYAARKAARGFEREGEIERELFGKNADLAEEQAQDAIARGREAEMRQRYRTRTLVGEQNAAFAGQGIVSGEGTAALVKKTDFALGESDALMIRENAAREALGFKRQADIYRQQGQFAYTRGRNQARALRYQTVTSLANFGGDMFKLYATGKTG